MTLITHQDAAALFGVCYEAYRKNRAKGCYRGLKIQRIPGHRPKVIKESVLEIKRRWITEE